MFDLLIEGGAVVDGTGNPWYWADVAIADGRIAAVGRLAGAEAGERINATGLTVTPGFIDMHGHSDGVLAAGVDPESRLLQGVTTEVIGLCGLTLAPIGPAGPDLLRDYTAALFGGMGLDWGWTTLDEYLARIEERGSPTNVVPLIGHGAVRIAAMGMVERSPTTEELATMRRLVAQGMEEGAFGLSAMLFIPPGCYADSREMAALAKVAAGYGGVFFCHIRSEGDMLLEAAQEALDIAHETRLPLQVAHCKVTGPANWGKSGAYMQLFQQACQKGIDVTGDQYPYLAGSGFMASLLPPWAYEGGVPAILARLRDPALRARVKRDMEEGLPSWPSRASWGGWDKVMVVACPRNPMAEGKTMSQLAQEMAKEPADVVLDLLLETGTVATVAVFSMGEEDLRTIMRSPLIMVGSDGLPGPGKAHPRTYGTFPRILGRYVREEKVLSLAEAIRKMTSLPAQRLGLWDRGLIREGMCADITIFDADKVIDKGTYAEPRQPPEGIAYVIVNGRVAVRQGRFTGLLGGRVLRRR